MTRSLDKLETNWCPKTFNCGPYVRFGYTLIILSLVTDTYYKTKFDCIKIKEVIIVNIQGHLYRCQQ